MSHFFSHSSLYRAKRAPHDSTKAPAEAAPADTAAADRTLDLSKIHYDDLAAAKAAHRAAKQGAGAGAAASTTVSGTRAIPESRKVHVVFAQGEGSEVKVPYELLKLSNGEQILRYSVDVDATVANAARVIAKVTRTAKANQAEVAGVTLQRPLVRAPFYAERKAPQTQLEYARAGVITPEMEYVALRESAANLVRLGKQRDFADKFLDSDEVASFFEHEVQLQRAHMSVTPEMVRDEIAKGHAVIPANHHHLECEPMIIGKKFLTKVNANIGASAISSSIEEEIAKLQTSLSYGADTVMDLSTGLPSLMELRSAILRASPVPIGTVPVYEALDRVGGDANALNWDVFKQVIIDQAEQGVDYFTIHAGLTKDLLPYAAKRLMGIVSRGGGIMASHMMQHDAENMAYENFDELMEICRRYDVALSLGDGLRPGAIYDACDRAQYGELENIGKLALRCRERGVQCFIEGPGHVPLDKVQENQEKEELLCHGAPFYTLGPLVTDVGAGFDHITSAIGGTTIGMHGTAMLCYVTPSEHLALPTPEDVKQGLITYKIAAHSADLAKGIKQSYALDHAMSRARATFRWYDQFALSFDMEHAYDVWRAQMDEEDCVHEASFCSMCGPRFCPIRLNRRLQSKYQH